MWVLTANSIRGQLYYCHHVNTYSYYPRSIYFLVSISTTSKKENGLHRVTAAAANDNANNNDGNLYIGGNNGDGRGKILIGW